MRLSRLLFAFLAAAVLVVSPRLQALGCWVCGHAYDTCLYYAETNYEAWNDGCNRMYTPGTAAHNQCLHQGVLRYNADYAQCEADLQQCGDWCESDDEDPKENCPIVLDLDNHGVRFTAAAEGVAFDIDGDGNPDPIAWTDPQAGDGFLVLDRNGNGVIDSGRELFGNVAAQLQSDAPNGFLALKLYDRNQDGLITANDRVFDRLRIWVDANQNGVSEASELSSLASRGIAAVEVDYRESRRKDRYGNELRYRGVVHLNDGSSTDAIDVFFRDAEQ